jgi:hypothetical protein
MDQPFWTNRPTPPPVRDFDPRDAAVAILREQVTSDLRAQWLKIECLADTYDATLSSVMVGVLTADQQLADLAGRTIGYSEHDVQYGSVVGYTTFARATGAGLRVYGHIIADRQIERWRQRSVEPIRLPDVLPLMARNGMAAKDRASFVDYLTHMNGLIVEHVFFFPAEYEALSRQPDPVMMSEIIAFQRAANALVVAVDDLKEFIDDDLMDPTYVDRLYDRIRDNSNPS